VGSGACSFVGLSNAVRLRMPVIYRSWSSLFLRAGKSLFPEALKRRIKHSLAVPSTEASLIGMQRNGFNPSSVVDVGAYVGDWTRLCKRLFPAAAILMIEPQAARRAALRDVAKQLKRVEVVSALLGPEARDAVPFYEAESASSVLPGAEQPNAPTARMAMTTLDAITAATPFAQPDFLKLDVQGYELDVLEGAPRALESAEAVLMEVNFLEIYAGARLFHDAVAFMAARRLQVYDIGTFFRRPYDNALWQADVIFVKSSSPLISSRRWE
jgi:FkbM family methyltransferase